MLQNEDNLNDVYDVLMGKLCSRGLLSTDAMRIIKDVFSIICEGGFFTVASVNETLEQLGWNRQSIDENCFELIISILESDYEYNVEKHTLH